MESLIIKELNADWKATETRIVDQQHHRNRTIVKEVVKTCDRFKKEISKYYLVKETHLGNEVDAIEKERNPYA